MIRRAVLVAALAILPLQGAAQSTPPGPEVQGLMDVLLLDQTFAVMQDEGVASATEMAEDMLPPGNEARWADQVATIYNATAMQDRFSAVFADEMAATPDLARQAAEFLGSEQGQRILQLEVDGRRALLDDAVEEAAKVAAADARADMDPRMVLIDDMAIASDLIEQNVAGALNANLAFYQGMAEVGALPDMDEGMMLQQVWASEPQVRADMEEWLFPFLYFAYQPLADTDLEAYVAFWETPAGQKLNKAMFAAYEAAFTPVSRSLGRASGRMMQGSDI